MLYYMSDDDDESGSYDSDSSCCMPRSAAPARSGGFTFDDKGFHVGGIARQSLVRVKLSKFSKEWYTAQLMLYGVPFVKTAGAQELLKTLESARKAGKTKTPTNAVVQIEQRLKAAYAKNGEAWRDSEFARLLSASQEISYDRPRFFAKYFLDDNGKPAPSKTRDGVSFRNVSSPVAGPEIRQRVAAIPGLAYMVTSVLTIIYWEKNRKKALDKAFDSISTASWAEVYMDLGLTNSVATNEANHDVGRFLSKYFSDRGTEKAITLIISPAKRAELHEAMVNYIGLTAGDVNVKHYAYCVIGWGKCVDAPLRLLKAEQRRIEAEERRIEAEERRIEAERVQKQREEEAEWRRYEEEKAENKRKEFQKKLGPHRQYMKYCTQPQGALKLAHLTGTYMLELADKELDENYSLHDDKIISICAPQSSHGCVAAFDLDLVSGTMLLALSNEDVHALVEEEEADEYGDEDEGDYEDDYYGGLGKRAARPQDGPQPSVRQKLETVPHPGRVYFQWAGRDKDRMINVDGEGRHTGYIDFDASKCTATGVLMHPQFFGVDHAGMAFSIYKTSDKPSANPDPWSNFTDEQWNIERRRRW